MKELNNIIDNHMVGLPSFQYKELHIGNEQLEFHYRDMLQCIQSLYGDPAFAQKLVHAPVQHYTSADQTCRIINEMHTGDWWWSIQVCSKVNYNNSRDLYNFSGVSRIKTAWCNHYPSHSIVRQDSTNALSQEDGIPDLYDNWKYSEGHPPQAISACTDPNRLHSSHLICRHYEQGRPTSRSRKPFPCMYGKGLSSDHTVQ